MAKTKQTDSRPNPDELLEHIKKDFTGKLTIFLGAAAGVGKTYTMLEAAQERLLSGANVVVGWIETHGRAETEKLTTGLPRVEPKIVEYRGAKIAEMNVDAIIESHPEVVLVDELAHTNVPGSRHVRRFQDVEELLKAGIDVFTTLNIQHIESLNDVVAQITGVIVRETVPDDIVEKADNVQLIDIPPEELIKRLKEGKVYIHGQAEQALKKFFRPGNINALRELSLRFTAQRVDADLAGYMRRNQIDGPWPAAGRVMVCISASPFSAQLIRAARRLAGGLHAEMLALHIQLPKAHPSAGEKDNDRLARNMRLAEDLGAEALTVVGENLHDSILEVVRTHNVGTIVIGKPRHSRIWELFHGSLVDQIIREGLGINVYVIQNTAESEKAPRIKTSAQLPGIPWTHFAGGLGMGMAVTAVSWFFQQELELVNIALIYLVPVLMSAVWWGRWPSYLTAVCCVFAFDFLFIPPVFTFSVIDIRYIWSFVIFLLVSFLIGGRTEELRSEAQAARLREKSTRSLYEFSKEIAAVVDPNTITLGLSRKVGETLDRTISVLAPDESGSLIVSAVSPQGPQAAQASEEARTEAEIAVATWVFQHNEAAGRSTETLPGSKFLYVPLTVRGNVYGVLAVFIDEAAITPEEHRLIDAWAGLAAIALERVKLAEKERNAELLVESDRLRNALLNSVSHELRTPLSSILGSVSTLIKGGAIYDEQAKSELLENIHDGARRMERLIMNLLDTARLESGMMKIKADACEAEDSIGSALRQLSGGLQNKEFEIHVPPDLPLLSADCVLLEQVLVNLVDNAIKYGGPDNKVTIEVRNLDGMVQFSVLDKGSGIPEEELPYVFDKFFRSRKMGAIGGIGLGLSICKGIVEAHGGRIWAENLAGGGTGIRFTIPIFHRDSVPAHRKGVNEDAR